MPVMQNYTGRTFGRITLSAPVPGKTGYWKGTCSCGNPVEKRIDNLKRPGDHSCGKCPLPSADSGLQERVKSLEETVRELREELGRMRAPTPAPRVPLAVQAVRTPDRPTPQTVTTIPVKTSPVVPPVPTPTSRYFGVTFDGEFWLAAPMPRWTVFWGDSEAEAAFAVRFYLETKDYPGYPRITDGDLSAVTEERRREITEEVRRYL